MKKKRIKKLRFKRVTPKFAFALRKRLTKFGALGKGNDELKHVENDAIVKNSSAESSAVRAKFVRRR